MLCFITEASIPQGHQWPDYSQCHLGSVCTQAYPSTTTITAYINNDARGVV